MTRLPHCVYTSKDEATTKMSAFLEEKATPFDGRNIGCFTEFFLSYSFYVHEFHHIQGLDPTPFYLKNPRITELVCKV